jgi:hypothetical protein
MNIGWKPDSYSELPTSFAAPSSFIYFSSSFSDEDRLAYFKAKACHTRCPPEKSQRDVKSADCCFHLDLSCQFVARWLIRWVVLVSHCLLSLPLFLFHLLLRSVDCQVVQLWLISLITDLSNHRPLTGSTRSDYIQSRIRSITRRIDSNTYEIVAGELINRIKMKQSQSIQSVQR